MKGISAQNRRQNRVLAVSLSTILLAGVLTGAHASRVRYLLALIHQIGSARVFLDYIRQSLKRAISCQVSILVVDHLQHES